MADFKAGDVVKMKSGGPLMTVARVEGDGDLRCIWSSEDKDKILGHSLPPTVLNLVPIDSSE